MWLSLVWIALWRVFCRSKITSDLIRYKNLYIRFNELASTKYAAYISRVESRLTVNPVDFWKYINNKRNVRGYPSQMVYNNVLCVDSTSFVSTLQNFLNHLMNHLTPLISLVLIHQIFNHLNIYLI